MESKHIIILVICVTVLSAAATSAINHIFVSEADNEPLNKLQIRIDQMEDLLDQEKTERLKLQQQIAQKAVVNINQSSQLIDKGSEVNETELADTDEQQLEDTPSADASQFRQRALARTRAEFRKNRLVNAGFAEAEANWLLKNESEVQLQSLYNDHEVQRAALQNSENSPRLSAAEQLRENIGDEFYERYLKANNRSTSVSVGSILDSSPGEIAGLKTGDRIVSYAGKRVFNVRDLNKLTVQGTAGESILIEVERNGSPMQLTIPRGPVGINVGRR